MIVQASNKPAPVKAPAFDETAKSILRATKAFDLAGSKWSAAVEVNMQQYVDLCVTSIGRSEAACKAAQAAIRDSQVVLDAVAAGVMEKKTFTEYAQGAARAMFHSVPWSSTLKNDPEMGLPWGKAGKGTAGAKAGKVTSTSREDLDKTLSKAIAQARMLGLTEFAAQVLDAAIESLDGFKEITE